MPNFIPAVFLPFLLFISKKSVRIREYLGMVAAILLVLCAYEAAQVWMPRRTFDWGDIAASGAGAAFGIVIGWMVYFRWLGSRLSARDCGTSKHARADAGEQTE